MIGIYKFENKINHHIYIGQSKNIEVRYRNHLTKAKNNYSSNTEYETPLHRAIRKYGIENFDFSVIEECSENQLNEREQYWIKYYNSYTDGYNQTTGGDAAEHAVKFNEDFIKNIQNILLTTDLIYDKISEQYGISTGRISEINTGKIGYNKEYEYPLRKVKIAQKYFCKDCGKEIWRGSIYCKDCANKHQRYIDRPSRNELKRLIRIETFVALGKQFGVTDNAIKKWCDAYNLPRTKRDIKKYSDEEWKDV